MRPRFPARPVFSHPPAAAAPVKRPCSSCFHRCSCKSPPVFSPIHILFCRPPAILSIPFLPAHLLPAFSFLFCFRLFLSCFCFPVKSGSVVFTKNPRGYPGSFSFGPLFKNPCMRANRLPFYVVRNRFVLFFLFPIYFLFSPPPCRVFLHKKTGP